MTARQKLYTLINLRSPKLIEITLDGIKHLYTASQAITVLDGRPDVDILTVYNNWIPADESELRSLLEWSIPGGANIKVIGTGFPRMANKSDMINYFLHKGRTEGYTKTWFKFKKGFKK